MSSTISSDRETRRLGLSEQAGNTLGSPSTETAGDVDGRGIPNNQEAVVHDAWS